MRISKSKENLMKLTKKILVAVLAVVLLATGVIFSSFATDGSDTVESPFHAQGINRIEDILEYYICDDYLALDYEDGDMGADYLTPDKDHTGNNAYYRDIEEIIAEDPTDPTNLVFQSTLPYSKGDSYEIKDANKEVWTDKVFLTMDVCFDESCQDNLSRFQIKVYYAVDGKVKASAGNLLNLSFTNDNVEYGQWTATGFGSTTAELENFVPQTGVWYSITVSFNAADDVCYFEIAERDGETYRVQYEIPGATGIWGFLYETKFSNTKYYQCKKVGTKTAEQVHNENVENYEALLAAGDPASACGAGTCRAGIYARYFVDNFEIYEGSTIRFPAQIEDITETTLLDIEQLYLGGTLTREDKFLAAQVMDKLYNGFEHEGEQVPAISDASKAVVPNAYKYINETYAYEIIERAKEIGTAANYYGRVDYLENQFIFYNGLLPEIVEGLDGIDTVTAEALNAAREVYATEVATLAEIKKHSDDFIAVMDAYEIDNKSYDYIVAIYEEGLKDIYAKRDADYEGIAAAETVFDGIVAKYERMEEDKDVFIEAVTLLETDAPTVTDASFAAAYAAYLIAYDGYNQYDLEGVTRINPDLDYTTHALLNEKVLSYEALAPEIEVRRDKCNAFNTIVEEASNASYLPSLKAILANVDAKYEALQDEYDYLCDYAGIVESYALYQTLSGSVAVIEQASAAYVSAVEAIATAEGLAAKKTAIAAANALKAAGNNLGVEGVKEANLALTAAEAEVNILEGNSRALIGYVEALEDATTLGERKALINSALAVVEGASEDYEGVTEAIAALDAAKAAFEADVAAMNAALESAMKNAINVA